MKTEKDLGTFCFLGFSEVSRELGWKAGAKIGG
jgi:hypothetical protein